MATLYVYPRSTEGGILFYLCPSVCPSVRPKIFFVAFFSAAIDSRNLIIGHKLHIGTSYRGKRWTYMHIFRHLFISNHWWQNSDISSKSSYCYAILWEVFLDPSDSYFLFADLVGLYTHWAYMHIFRHIFLNNYWW